MTPKEIAEKIEHGWVDPTIDELDILAAAYLKLQEPLGDERLGRLEALAIIGFSSTSVDAMALFREIRRLRAAAEVDRAEIERLKDEIVGHQDLASIRSQMKAVLATRADAQGGK